MIGAPVDRAEPYMPSCDGCGELEAGAQTEAWSHIAGFPGYQVSNFGRLLGKTGSLLNPCLDSYGYETCSLRRDGGKATVKIHTLVTLAFVGPKPSQIHTVAHGDGCRTNNRANNLRWATMREQYQDRVRHGTDYAGEKNNQAKLSDKNALDIRALYVPGSTTHGRLALAIRFGVTVAAIKDCLSGKSFGHLPGARGHRSTCTPSRTGVAGLPKRAGVMGRAA